MLPNQAIQNQTGGTSRTRATNPTEFQGSCPEPSLRISATATATAIATAAEKSPADTVDDDLYGNRGYSDIHHHADLTQSKSADSVYSSSNNHTANATSKKDAYQRYLQQKQEEEWKAEQNLKKAQSYTSNNSTEGRPPRRSSSPGLPQNRSTFAADGNDNSRQAFPSATSSYSLNSSLLSNDSNSKQRSGCEDKDDHENNEHGAQMTARELRARRLAQQQHLKPQKTTSGVHLPSQNQAVQAYLASKEKERQQLEHDQSTGSDTLTTTQRRQQQMEQKKLEHLQQPELQHKQQPSIVRSSSVPGRPPAHAHAPTQPTSVQTESNVTTYTYQFQPTTTRKINTEIPPHVPYQRSQSTSETDTSVTRARRLLLQSNLEDNDTFASRNTTKYSLEQIDGSPSPEGDCNDAIASNAARRRNYRSASATRPPLIKDPPAIARSMSSGRTTTAANDWIPGDTCASSANRANSMPAELDSSVTRARRLLQENKGRSPSPVTMQQRRSTSAPGTIPAINTASTPAVNTTAKQSTSSNNSKSSTNNTSKSNTDWRSNLYQPHVTAANSSSTTANDDDDDQAPPPFPKQNSRLQNIPSGIENDDWSVRVSIISAIDFPVHVVPNMPLSPVLKLGLVSIPSIQAESYQGQERLLRDIDRKGLGAVAPEMRSTTTKLLSKRDNGAVEFHEEIRWDHVVLKPGSKEILALAVELCAKGCLRPANLHESPPPHDKQNTNKSHSKSPIRGRAVTPTTPGGGDTSSSPAAIPEGGIRPGGRIANFLNRRKESRKGKETASQLESAQAAAAVAKLLVQGSASPITPNKDVIKTSGTADISAPPVPTPARGGLLRSSSGAGLSAQDIPQEWDVTLRHSPSVVPPPPPTPEQAAAAASSIVMSDDIRLGSLLIPITDIEDLQQTLQDRSKPARLEKWFEVQNMNPAVMNSNATVGGTAGSGGPGRWLQRESSTASSGNRSQSPTGTGGRSRRNPSILLELSLYAPDVLDDSEDEMDEDDDDTGLIPPEVAPTKSFAKRTTLQVRNQLRQQLMSATASAASPMRTKRDAKKEALEAEKGDPHDPVLEPGIIDFISIVGARDIGDQRQDDGSKGWVNSTPECCILEQFPPSEDFHLQQHRNRNAMLPQKVEWFCFPEGVKLWRGSQPPTGPDFLSQQQQQTTSSMISSQTLVSESESTSLALFDAYLNCTTSFNWFVIASNSDEYGSNTHKTYGAVIRFYVPAPRGIDPTQDDFAQTLMGGDNHAEDDDDEFEQPQGLGSKKEKKRLWVPIGICVTSSLPIIGVMEAVLMRCAEMMASRPQVVPSEKNKINNMIQRHIANLILNCQRPIRGAVNTRVPFLLGEPLKVNLAPKSGLPQLPHGNSVSNVCRLLGPEGFIFILAALLTESKIVLHSHNTSNCSMVAEVMTALIYPFAWAMPYIPVLPVGMLEFIEAPLSYLLGIPSSCLDQLVDPSVLEDVVVVDLDLGFSSPNWKTTTTKYKTPTPLPSMVASNLSRAVYRLLRKLENEQEYEEKHSHPVSNASDRLPRIHPESQAEREFRIAIALEIGGLVRGYQDCLVFVSTQTVFNREKFLKRAPALFIEEPSGGAVGSRANKVKTNRRILSSRSKRFLSILVNCQHFHQFLETLRSEECSFFHEVMEQWIIKGDESSKSSDVSVFHSSATFDYVRAITLLSNSLALEETLPEYEVKLPHSSNPNGSCPEDDVLEDSDYQILSREKRFPRNLLQQIDVSSTADPPIDGDATSVASKCVEQQGVHHASLSLQYLVELEKNPWKYDNILDISVPNTSEVVSEVIAGDQSVLVTEKVKLRDAIGDKKFRVWRAARERMGEEASASNSIDDSMLKPGDFGTTLDLASLMTSTTEESFSDASSTASFRSSATQSAARRGLTPDQQRVANAKDRDVLRRCLEKAYAAKRIDNPETVFMHHGRDLVSQAEIALRNPQAQNFLLSLLNKRSKLDAESRKQTQSPGGPHSSNATSASSSRLEPIAFECVVRLCCSMLDANMDTKDYEPAYLLLVHTAGLHTLQSSSPKINCSAAEPSEVIPIYMTARIGLHPLFADLNLWMRVLSFHLAEKQATAGGMGNSSDRFANVTDSVNTNPSLSRSESFDNDVAPGDAEDEKEYEAAVATLYEMVGYGIPSEELARFSSRVAQEYGWFKAGSEKGQSLLLLARRLSMRREMAENGGMVPGEAGDLGILQMEPNTESHESSGMDASIKGDDTNYQTIEYAWCHPQAPVAVSGPSVRRSSNARAGMLRGGGQQTDYMNRSAVTTLATLGPSVVVSGGLDGGVFLSRLATTPETGTAAGGRPSGNVRGIHLDWGSSGSRAIPGSSASSSDGEYGVGAVSCLAAAGRNEHQQRPSSTSKDVVGLMDDEDMVREMGDSRVIAGTTCGDLRIWSVKDVYAAMYSVETGEDAFGMNGEAERFIHADGSISSSVVPPTPTRRRRLGGAGSNVAESTAAAGGSNNPFNRLKFSLRGRALSGHRGGVTCIDVPSHFYRPDSVVTGGADGLIKLWSLRTPGIGRNRTNSNDAPYVPASSSSTTGQLSRRLATNRGGDAQSIFSGHGGRVLCVKTAWHGDRLLSGGADRTLRVWDMSGASNAGAAGGNDAACLHTLSGHFGWVTQVQYWGANTIVSGSTDRSIALWDARVRNSPLFVLRHHHAPISNILVGPRTDPLMISSATDGSVTTWDFRSLSGSIETEAVAAATASGTTTGANSSNKRCKVVRHPAAVMNLGPNEDRFSLARSGPVLLSRGTRSGDNTVVSIGSDAVVREWKTSTGKLVQQWNSGHCDALSHFSNLSDASLTGPLLEGGTAAGISGTITSSWDGTIRMRKRIPLLD